MASMCEAENPSPNIHITEEWSEAAHSISNDSFTSPPPIAFICGPKNSGKTTFSRYLLNTLLHSAYRYRKAAYLDTDVGQPEFTTPGFLSLTVVDKLTPDLTIPCLKTPERCFFFGDVSAKRDPAAYLKYTFSLYDYYRKEYCMISESAVKTELPVIVNTAGWVKGIGYDILVDMLKYIAPTHVVKISISTESKNLPAGAFWSNGDYPAAVNLIEIHSACEVNRSVPNQKNARLLRDLRIMAYFQQCFPSDLNITTIKELAHALASHPPYEVMLSNIKIRHLHCQVPSTEIFYSLNATIVGLAISSEEAENLPSCVGLGIVRAIDTFKGSLYVITPVPPSMLEKVDLLLQGFIQIPACLLQVRGCISPYMSANVLSAS
ncbi:MobB domain-containing protein/Clp1 domain-containing protein [Cephalotus follicularis]|uniref:MobB domain-containing protein/Clp1 domain-containing protein n=1 Tax=Cephalotus follicularis TaxID=3775 RepID=A0A1Q3C2T2_CEPFO|nr:MobB domain-containing protein/Clp1 domain-containing protein [Cephalotus follicularis]